MGQPIWYNEIKSIVGGKKHLKIIYFIEDILMDIKVFSNDDGSKHYFVGKQVFILVNDKTVIRYDNFWKNIEYSFKLSFKQLKSVFLIFLKNKNISSNPNISLLKRTEYKIIESKYRWSNINGITKKYDKIIGVNGSKYEIITENILHNYGVVFQTQKTFHGCSHISLLRFDFYLPYHNTCIEVDGEQHFKSVEHWGGEEGFLDRKIKDEIKNDYCLDNKMCLIRIPYTQINNIEIILKKHNIIK